MMSSSANNKPRLAKAIVLNRLSARSLAARDRALHVIAAMRHDPKLSLTRAARVEGIKSQTVKKYLPSALKQSSGRFRVTKSDRYAAILYVPDARGNANPVRTNSSRERELLGQYLRDLGRYLRGNRDALAPWHGRQVAGVELLTSGRAITGIEPVLSDFSLYKTLNGDAA